jgi:hypothetical protein
MEDPISYESNSHTGEEKAITDFEKLYPELAKEFKAVQKLNNMNCFLRKMMDYGLSKYCSRLDL